MTNQDRLDIQWQLFSDKFYKFCVDKYQRHSRSLLIEVDAETASTDPKYAEAKAYHSHLLELSDTELNNELQESIALKLAAREAKHPFNQPEAFATDEVFEFWSRAEVWMLAEAAALINGRNPEFITELKIENVPRDTKIGKLLTDTYELLERARLAGKLYRSNSPIDVINWAELKAIQLPQKLVKLTLERSKSSFTVAQENKILRERLTKIEAQNQIGNVIESNGNPEKPLGARERDSLLKLVLGMAIKGYSFDPNATRSSEITEIANDLVEAGLPLEADTVRKYLNEAKALFSDALNRTEDR